MAKYIDEEFGFEMDATELLPSFPEGGSMDLSAKKRLNNYLNDWGKKYHSDIYPVGMMNPWPYQNVQDKKEDEVFCTMFEVPKVLSGDN